jgi:beta-lactam-binding protein with PASTA domain
MRLFRRKREPETPYPHEAPTGRIVVQFVSEADADDGEEVGQVFIFDDGQPDTHLEKVKWMSLTDAKKLAQERGYEFQEM